VNKLCVKKILMYLTGNLDNTSNLVPLRTWLHSCYCVELKGIAFQAGTSLIIES